MRKLLVLSAGLIMTAGIYSGAWAHGSGGFGPGYGNYPYSAPGFRNPSHFYKHRYFRGHRRTRQASPQAFPKPYFRSGVLISPPGPLQRKIIPSPIVKARKRGIGRSPFLKSLSRKSPEQGPPALTPHPHPDPWFLYGKGDVLRQMGYLPQAPPPSSPIK